MSQAIEQQQYSILRGRELRPLHVVVAQQLVSTEPDHPRRRMLLRLYSALPIEERSLCRAALVTIDG